MTTATLTEPTNLAQAGRSSALVIGAFLITSVLNYVFGVGLSWFLEPTAFGVLGVAQSLLLLMALIVSAGFSWAANYDLAAEGVNEQSRHRFRAAWLANVILGLALAAGLWIAYSSGLLDLGLAYRLVVPAVGVTTILLAARAVVNGAAQGLFRFGPVATNQVLEVAVKFGAGLALVALGYGVAGVMAGFAVGAAVALGHSLWIVRPDRLWSGRGWFDRQLVRGTLPLFVGMLGPALILNLDILGLKLLTPGSGDTLAGFYQAALILARIPVFTARAITMVIFSYVAGSRRQPTEASYGRAAVLAWQRLLLPASLALVIAPEAAIGLIFPNSYQAAVPYLRLAAAGGGLLALMTLLMGITQASDQRRPAALVALAATMVQVVTLVLAVPSWGATGAALSLVVAGAVGVIGLVPLFLRNQPWPTIGIGRELLPLIALALPLMLVPDGSRLVVLVKLGAAAAAYLIVLVTVRYPAIRARQAGQARLSGITAVVYEIVMGD